MDKLTLVRFATWVILLFYNMYYIFNADTSPPYCAGKRSLSNCVSCYVYSEFVPEQCIMILVKIN